MDKIFIKSSQVSNIYDWGEKNEDFIENNNFMPFLDKGIMCVVVDEINLKYQEAECVYLLFDNNVGEDLGYSSFELGVYTQKEAKINDDCLEKRTPFATYKSDGNIIKREDIKLEISQSAIERFLLGTRKMKDELKWRGFDKELTGFVNNFTYLYILTNFYFLEYKQDLGELESKEFIEKKDKNKNKKNKSNKKEGYYKLNKTFYFEGKMPNRKIQHLLTCECWGVRGHIRHYANGKTSFIKSYQKGKKRYQIDPKNKNYAI